MIQTTKTKAHIESFTVDSGRPKNNGKPVIIRAPLFMKCFRATIAVNNYMSGIGQDVFISTAPTNQEENCVFLSAQINTTTNTPPDIDFSYTAERILVLDRRGVGYMEDELYFYSESAVVTIVWEGIVG